MMHHKIIDSVSVDDIRSSPVWKFARHGEMALKPLKLPCSKLDGCIIGTQVKLADGTMVWATLGNIDTANPDLTRHYLTLAVDNGGKWFHMARYHDYDYAKRGPKELAKWLGKPINDVFPIDYDIRSVFSGESDALIGRVEKEFKGKLTLEKIMELAVPRVKK